MKRREETILHVDGWEVEVSRWVLKHAHCLVSAAAHATLIVLLALLIIKLTSRASFEVKAVEV